MVPEIREKFNLREPLKRLELPVGQFNSLLLRLTKFYSCDNNSVLGAGRDQ
jgi:hypothetical protein